MASATDSASETRAAADTTVLDSVTPELRGGMIMK